MAKAAMRVFPPLAVMMCLAGAFSPAYSQSPVLRDSSDTFEPAKVLVATDTRFPIRSLHGGIVVLTVALDAQGTILRASAHSDDSLLTDTAVASVRSWKLQSATEQRVPQDSSLAVAFVFRPPVTLWKPPPFHPVFPAAEGGSRISGYVPPGFLSVAYAEYPLNTVASGSVVVQVSVNKQGTVEDVKVIHALAPFTPGAINAARQWRFQPATLHGQSVDSKVAIAFVFEHPVLNPPLR